jgi:hypothetical protein
MVKVTLELEVTLPETTDVKSEQDAVDEAYEIVDSAPAFDQIDAEELAHHTTDTRVEDLRADTAE